MRGATPLILPRVLSRERVGLFGLGQGAWLGGGGLGLVVPLEPFHLFDELADVLELAIDRGESDIGDRVEALEMVHDDPSELLAADLLLGPLVELSLDLEDVVVESLNSDRPLLRRLQDGATEALAVEGRGATLPV